MSIVSFIFSRIVGAALPRYRTLGQWAGVYTQIVEGLPVTEKTKKNRRASLARLLDGLGAARIISSIRPHHIAAFINSVYKSHPPLSKRLLIEAKAVFNAALNYGWLDRNPAQQVKALPVTVQRNRLTLEQWHLIKAHSEAHQPPWVSRMMVLALVSGQRRSDLVKLKFSDVWDDHLHVEQAKTGSKVSLPLALRLYAIDVSLGEAIEACRDYSFGTEYLLRKHNGQRLGDASLSARFEESREAAIPPPKSGSPVSLHECRSLAERLYRLQGINTMLLLGHSNQQMTDLCNDDRGLSAGKWKTLALS